MQQENNKKKDQEILEDYNSDSDTENSKKIDQNKKFISYESLINRDCIRKFLRPYEYQKQFICDKWFNGSCIFPDDICIHAHGITDIKNFQKQQNNIINTEQKYNKQNDQQQYRPHPKLPKSEFGHKNFLQLIEYAKKHQCFFKDQYTLVNFNFQIRLKIRKQYQCQIILEVVEFLYNQYTNKQLQEYLTLETLNNELNRIGFSYLWGNYKNQIFYWQKMIEKIPKLRRKFFISRQYISKTKNKLNYNTYILECPEKKNMDQIMADKLYKYTKQVLKTKQFPLSQYDIIQLAKQEEQSIQQDLENGIQNNEYDMHVPYFQSCLEIYYNNKLRFFFEEVFINNFQDLCEKLGIDLQLLKKELQQQKQNNEKQQSKKQTNDDQDDDDDENEDEEEETGLQRYFDFENKKKKYLSNEDKNKEISYYLNELKIPNGKQTLCRFYIRGCCMFKKSECKYAHDLCDLQNFTKLSQVKNPQDIDYQYKIKDYDQRPLLQHHRIQYSLFEYQHKLHKLQKIDKIYTLDELSNNKKLRIQIRNLMLQNMYQEFYFMLLDIYKDDNFYITEKFLVSECNRVGFNKIGSHPTQYKYVYAALNNKVAYDAQILIPPRLHQKLKLNCIFPLPSTENLTLHYSNKIIQIIQDLGIQNQYPVNELDIKKQIYKLQTPLDVPFHSFLQIINKNFPDFLQHIFTSQQNKEKITQILNNNNNKDLDFSSKEKFHENISYIVIFDFDKERVSEFILNFLKNKQQQQNQNYIWKISELEQEIQQSIQFQQNIWPKVKDFIRTQLLQKKNYLIFNPTGVYILQQQQQTKQQQSQQQNNNNICSCQNIQLKLEEKQILETILQQEDTLLKQFEKERVILVDNQLTLNYSFLQLVHLQQKNQTNYLGVDLEGQLRFGGSVDLLQISAQIENKTQIFIFDIQTIQQEKILYEKTRYLLYKTLSNEKITKILHDCRKDSIAIHFSLGICLKNVFDTSATHIFIQNLENYLQYMQNNKGKDSQIQILRQLEYNIKWPGLNEILQTYGAEHGIIQNKAEMHSKFSDPNFKNYFKSRPIQPDYLEYSARDVEDLIQIRQKMLEKVTSFSTSKQLNLKKEQILQCMNHISNDYSKQCFVEFKEKIIQKMCNQSQQIYENAFQQLQNI